MNVHRSIEEFEDTLVLRRHRQESKSFLWFVEHDGEWYEYVPVVCHDSGKSANVTDGVWPRWVPTDRPGLERPLVQSNPREFKYYTGLDIDRTDKAWE